MSMKSVFKSRIIFLWRFLSVYYSFFRRHKQVYKNGEFKKNKLTKSEKNEYLNYWKQFFPIVSIKTVEISKSLTGEYNKFIVPEEIYAVYVEPCLNFRSDSIFMENKNFYNKWFGGNDFPMDYFHKIDGRYYDDGLNEIKNIDVFIEDCDINYPIILKPSVDSFGGKDIYFIKSKEELKITHRNFTNLVVQEKIEQSELMSKFNPDSINTIRVCLLKVDGDFQIINSSLRMGKDGSLDNETAGGIVCNIFSDGRLNSYAVDKHCRKFKEHPNTHIVFDEEFLPYYNELIFSSKKIAEKIFNTNLVSLDMCLDVNNNWRCIELNLFGQTIRFAQYAGNAFFGDYTDAVLKKIIEKNTNI